MAKDAKEAAQGRTERREAAEPWLGRAGASTVGPTGIALTAAYLILFSVLLLYQLVWLWPPATPTGSSALTSSPAAFLLWAFPISDEARLLLIVAVAGALGALVHALRSFYWYVGNRQLVVSWLVRYLLLPFVGAALGLVFYLVIRAGFFSPEATSQQASPYGFAALAGLVGMFSEQAVLKLKELAENLLAKPQQGADAKPQQ